MSQIRLLKQRGFGSLFWVQFLGAFNDNLFKNALTVGVTYRAISVGGLSGPSLVALSSGLFVLPFFLFSALGGQIADKVSKTALVRILKATEILVMGVAAAGFVLDNIPLLLVTLFLMGTQSSFFGPVKYGILPELLERDDLTGGNALVESGTFGAILLGTMAGGLLGDDSGRMFAAGLVVVIAICGYIASRFAPRTAPAVPDLKIGRDPIRPLIDAINRALITFPAATMRETSPDGERFCTKVYRGTVNKPPQRAKINRSNSKR